MRGALLSEDRSISIVAVMRISMMRKGLSNEKWRFSTGCLEAGVFLIICGGNQRLRIHPSKMFDRQQQKRLWGARDIALMLADHSTAYKFTGCCPRRPSAFISPLN